MINNKLHVSNWGRLYRWETDLHIVIFLPPILVLLWSQSYIAIKHVKAWCNSSRSCSLKFCCGKKKKMKPVNNEIGHTWSPLPYSSWPGFMTCQKKLSVTLYILFSLFYNQFLKKVYQCDWAWRLQFNRISNLVTLF